MAKRTILIFGESKEGQFQKLLFINSLPKLATILGEPTETGIGVHIAIQAMLYNLEVLFYKVKEEGSDEDAYLQGFRLIEKEAPSLILGAIALPGASTPKILEIANSLCDLHNSLILSNERDLYDYITRNRP